MREVTIGDKPYMLHASPLSIALHKQEFGTDILPDSYHLELVDAGSSADADFVTVLKVLWTLIRTADATAPDFDVWTDGIDTSFADAGVIAAACGECRRGFYVRPRSGGSGGTDSPDAEIGVLVTAKRVGLSFDELNMLTLDSFITFIDVFAGKDSSAPRKATQADINALLG